MVYVNIVLSFFLIELVVDCLVLKIFKIYFNRLYLIFLQIPKICASVICLIYSNILWLCFLVKILSKLLCLFFITDSFKAKRLLSLFLLELILLFSVGGFLEFMLLIINSTANDLFVQQIDKKYSFLIIISLIIYIFAFFRIVRIIEKNKFLRSFLVDVSFSVFDKHINLYALIDSGNLLFDPLTRLPVVLISRSSLSKFLTEKEIELLIGCRKRKISCNTISGSDLEIPIFKIKNFNLKTENEIRKYTCMIGIVEHKFDRGKIDCLLHRDFL